VPQRTVYLIDELWLEGDRVPCRYAVAFVTARDRSEWHAIVYDPTDSAVLSDADQVRFAALTRDGARLHGRVAGGRADTSMGAEYLAGIGPLSIRGEDRKPVVLGPADDAARELGASSFIGGRLYSAADALDTPERSSWSAGRLWASLKRGRPWATVTPVGLVALCCLAVWGGVSAVVDLWHVARDAHRQGTVRTAVQEGAGVTVVPATRVLVDGLRIPTEEALVIRERTNGGRVAWTVVLLEHDDAERPAGHAVQLAVETANVPAYWGPAYVAKAAPGPGYLRLTTATPSAAP
jgi:hypothetical protein